MRRCAYILAWLLLVLPTAAGAVPFGVADILSNFNAVVQGNFSTSSDVAGPVAIGGTISGTGTFFNQGLPMGAAFSGFGSVNVYGNASNATYNANMIVVDVGGTGSNATFSGASAVRYGVSYPISFSSLWAPLTALSAGMSTLSPTSAAALPSAGANTAVLSATAATVKGYGKIGVIDISASLLQSYTGVSVALNGADTVIINVTGNFTGNPNFQNGSNYRSNVIWNFVDATSVNLGSYGIEGTVLALNATVTNSNPIEGTLVAANYVGTGEIHYYPFAGQAAFLNSFTTAVPEVGSLVLLSLGIVTLAWRRRQTRA